MSKFRLFNLVLGICLLGITLSNCGKEEGNDCPNPPSYQPLTASVKEWFPYNSNRNLIFETSTSVRDTVALSAFFSGDGEVWNGDECPATKGEFLKGNIVDKRSGDTIKVLIGYSEQVIIQKNAGLLHYFDTQRRLTDASTSKRFEPTITLNNKTYTSVLVFECSPGDNCITTGITKFYFSKTRGLVAFQRNNVLYTLR